MAKARKTKKAIVSDSKYRPDIQSLIPPARLSIFGTAYSLAILCSLGILVLSLITKYTGQGTAALDALKPFFLTKNNLQLLGITSNMAEAALHGLVFGLLFSWLYNKLA